jgi:hypothetical protein
MSFSEKCHVIVSICGMYKDNLKQKFINVCMYIHTSEKK